MSKNFSKTNLFSLLSFAFVVWLFPRSAHAYLDPGTGSVIVQALVAGVAGFGVVAKLAWQKIMGKKNNSSPPSAENSDDEGTLTKKLADE